MKTNRTIPLVASWIARLFALLLCLFWGAFFVAHLREWFFGDSGVLPPTKVWIGQFLHLVMIVGLAILIFWPRLGAVVTILGTASFFSSIGMKEFPWIALMNLIPIAFVVFFGSLRKSQTIGIK